MKAQAHISDEAFRRICGHVQEKLHDLGGILILCNMNLEYHSLEADWSCWPLKTVDVKSGYIWEYHTLQKSLEGERGRKGKNKSKGKGKIKGKRIVKGKR